MQQTENKPLITEDLIRSVVYHFYEKVRQDDMLAPIFDSKIKPDEWDAHLERMIDFWSAILLSTGRYSGRPHALHKALPVNQVHFARWLELFHETVQSLCTQEAAYIFFNRASRIAFSLQSTMGLNSLLEISPAETR